jgi:hypothetical protein
VYTLCRVVRSIAIVASHVRSSCFGISTFPCSESVVSHGCSRGEESGSLYLTDPIAIIKVRGEEVLASTLDGGRMWRWGPRIPGGSELC